MNEIARPAPLLTAGDLALVPWRAADSGRGHRAVASSLAHLRPWMPWAVDGYDLTRSQEYTARCERAWASGAEFSYAMAATADPSGAVWGSAGLRRRIAEDGLEIGYWVHVDHVRRGLATRAAALLAEAGLALPGITHVQIHHDPTNEVSGRVPRRLGFTHVHRIERPAEAPAETPFLDVWRLTADAYPASGVPALLAAAG